MYIFISSILLVCFKIWNAGSKTLIRWWWWWWFNFNHDQSTLVQVMAWCHQSTSHYLDQYWPRSLLPYSFTMLFQLQHMQPQTPSVQSAATIIYKSPLTHLPLDKMAAISQTIFSNAFSWIKNLVFWLKFHWRLFPGVQLTILQHWFR